MNDLQKLQNELYQLRAEIIEYRHALGHVAEPHFGGCGECRSMALGALAGTNRAMCLDLAKEDGWRGYAE